MQKLLVKYHCKRAQKGRGMRDLCKICNQRPVAINYYKEGKPFYRSKCDHCATGRGIGRPLWVATGYKKKATCDRCGFTSKYQDQFNVFHVDGNLTNCRHTNLKTVCANCQRLLHKLNLPWKQGDLTPDF
jgi:hypothetical protein